MAAANRRALNTIANCAIVAAYCMWSCTVICVLTDLVNPPALPHCYSLPVMYSDNSLIFHNRKGSGRNQDSLWTVTLLQTQEANYETENHSGK